ncbi:MAG: DUF2066 domain-containing protein [Pseudomonadota bacterium]
MLRVMIKPVLGVWFSIFYLKTAIKTIAVVTLTMGAIGNSVMGHAQTGTEVDQVAEIYQVSGIAVDEQAQTTVLAQEAAFAGARAMAFMRLLGRLAGAEAARTYGTPPRDELDTLIESLQVESEQTGPGRYIGTFTVVFDPQAVRVWLARSGIAYTELAAEKVVVAPLLNIGGDQFKLWQPPNDWYDAWLRRSKEPGLVPFIIPLPELSTITALSSRQAVIGDRLALERLAQAHDARTVLVATLTPRPRQEYLLGLRWYGGVLDGQSQVMTLTGDYEGAAARAVKATEDLWREVTSRPGGGGFQTIVTVVIDRPTIWFDILPALRNLEPTVSSRILAMTYRRAHLALTHGMDVGQLRSLLEQQGLRLTRGSQTQGGTQIYQLSLVSLGL